MDAFNNNKKDDTKDKNWFARTSLQIGSLALATTAIYKMHGPAKSLANKYLEEYKLKIIQRSAWKRYDSQTRLLGPDAAINRPGFGIDFEDKEFKRLFPDSNNLIFETDSINLAEIERSESSLILSIENAIGNETVINKNEMLFKLKVDTLYEYINTRSLLRAQDRSELNAIKDIKDIDKLDALHRYYLEHSKDYSSKYGRNLSSAKTNYRTSINKVLSLDESNRPDITEAAAKDFMYGTRTFDTTPETAAIFRYQGGKLARDRTNINVFDLLKTDKKVTSGSLSEAIDLPTHGNFANISKFEYNSYLKKIATKLEELQSDTRPNSMVRNVRYNITSEHSMGDRKRWFLNVTLVHKVKGEASIRIPLSQHGIISGSSAGTTDLLDGFYGKDFLCLHPETTNLHANLELENMSQRLMRLFYTFLDSDLIEGSFAVDPKHFETRVTSTLGNVLRKAPAMEGNDRDFFKMTRLVLPTLGSKKSKYNRQRLQNVVDTGAVMKHFSNAIKDRSNFIKITLDFETLSRDLIGPQWMAKDSFTEITKAGFVISDYENGKVVDTNIQELVSDHAISSFDRWRTKKDSIAWLRREVGAPSDMADSQVVDLWKSKIKKEASDSFKRSGVSFKNNRDVMAHVTKVLLSKIRQAVRDRKQIFFVTKNGAEFDLQLLQSHAGAEWGEMKKYVKFIDIQANAKLHQLQGNDESMTLTKMIMRLMRNKQASTNEIASVAHGNMQSAVDFFRRKGMIQIKKELLDDYINQGVIGRAHTSATDALFTDVLLIHDHEDLYGHPGIYKQLDEISKLLKKGASLTPLDESFEEARANERRYKIEGQVVSSSMLSQGQQAKELMSMFSPHHIIPFSDSPMSSQRDQFFGGVKVQASDFWLKGKNMVDRQLYNKYFKSVFVSKGEVSAMRTLKSDAMTNQFQHHIIADTIYTFNSWAGQEGYSAFSEEALKKYTIHVPKKVDLSTVMAGGDDASLNNRLIQLQKKIFAKATQLAAADHGKINSKHYNDAAQIVIHEMDSRGLTVINKGEFSLQLSHGDSGIETVKKEMGGKIVNILVNEEAGKFRMHAELNYVANGVELADIVGRARDPGSKSMATVDRWNSLLIANNADKVANADFFTKGDVGVHKQLLVEKAMHKLFDTYNYGSSNDKIRAKEALERLARDVKSTVNYEERTFVHDYDAPSMFKNITDPDDIAHARKFYGNIDMNFKKLNTHLVAAGIVWKEQEYKNWLGMFGNDKQRIQNWINAAIKNHTSKVRAQMKNSQSLYSRYSESDINQSIEDFSVHIQNTFLPNWNDVKAGTAAKDWEPFQKFKNDPSTFVPGFRTTTRSAIYQIMNGGEFKMTKLKSRGNLLHMIDLPFSHVSKSTIADLRSSKRAYAGDRFTAAMATLTRFKDALMSKANIQGGDLSISDIEKLLDNTGGVDVKKLARWVFNDGEKASIINTLTKYMDEIGDNSENREAVINDILVKLQHNKYAAAFAKNKNIMTTIATDVWENLAKEKGVFAYSRKQSMGGSFSFHLGDLLQNSAGYSKDELPKVQGELLNAFENIYRQDPKGGIVENFDRERGIVKLRKIIMHADTSKENIANILNPLAKEKAVSMASSSTKYQRDVLEAIRTYEFYSVKEPDLAAKSEEMLKKQYLTYLHKGMLLDKTSIYHRAIGEIAPHVAQSHVVGAGIISEKAGDILSTGGLASKGFKGKNVKPYEDLLRRLSGNKTNMADIYMSSSQFKKMKFSNGVNVIEHLTKVFGSEKANLIAAGMSEESLPGYMTRHPQMQSGIDAVLDNKLHIIPDELAPMLGMNSNEVNVHAIYTGLFKMDFDGDQGQFALKAFEDAEALGRLHKEHSTALAKALDSFTTKEIIPLRKAGQKLWYRDFSNGKINVSSFDEAGNLSNKSIDITSSDATTMMEDLFSTVAKNAHTLELSDHSRVTMGSAQKHIDQLAATQIAKGNIGIFTHTAYKRARTLMQVGLVGKDPIAAKMLIGNLVTGDASIAQMFVSLAKHEGDIRQYAMAAKAYLDPSTKDEAAQKELETLYKSRLPAGSHETFKTWKESMSLYNDLVPRDQMSRASIRSMENLDLGREGTTVLDALSIAQTDFVRDYGEQYQPDYRTPMGELGDTIGKRFSKFGDVSTFFKKGGAGRKGAAIGAAIYIATNFFRPNQLSNSLNPMDAFTDLGADIDGNHNRIFSDLELDRNVPLDMVNASFSKQAFVRMNKDHNRRDRSQIIQNILDNGYKNSNPLLHEWKTAPNLSYSNYTTSIPSFGSSQLDRRTNY